MNPFSLPLWARALILAAIVAAAYGAYASFVHHQREIGRTEGRAEVQAKWDKQTRDVLAAALTESQAKAKESLRRTEAQQRNQDAQDLEIVALRDAAARNAADADRVRKQSAAAARDWAARLADSPTREDLAAAAAAITVLTDVRGRLDAAAGELASYAGASRSAGLKCSADYDALTVKP